MMMMMMMIMTVMMTMKSSSFFITTSTHAVYLSEQRFEVSDTFRVTLRVRQIDF